MTHNRIISSSTYLSIEGKDWLRKVNEDNIMWIPMFADYYYAYRVIESQWWYVDEKKKFKVDAAPDMEAAYEELLKPQPDFKVLEQTTSSKVGNIGYHRFMCLYKDVKWERCWEQIGEELNFVRWGSPNNDTSYLFTLNDKFKDVWHIRPEGEVEFIEINGLPEIEIKYQEMKNREYKT